MTFVKESSCEFLFTTCFISELINKSFPEKVLNAAKDQKNYTNGALCSLENRMRSWNYLVSLLSLKGVIDEDIFIRSMRMIVNLHERSINTHEPASGSRQLHLQTQSQSS